MAERKPAHEDAVCKGTSAMDVRVDLAILENPEKFIGNFEKGITDGIASGRRDIQDSLDATIEWGDVQSR